jgi:outer membrane protein
MRRGALFALAVMAACAAPAMAQSGNQQAIGRPALRGANDTLPGVGLRPGNEPSPLSGGMIDPTVTGSVRHTLRQSEMIDLARDARALRGSVGADFFYSRTDATRLRWQVAKALRPAAADGLRGTVEAAVYSNYGLRASLHDLRAAEKNVWSQLLRFAPVVSGELGANNSAPDFYGLGAGSKGDGRYGALTVSLPLLTGGERYFSYKSAQSSALSAGYGAAAAREAVVLDTVNAYLQHVYAAQATRLYGEDAERLSGLLTAMKAQRAGGFVSGADVAEVERELAGRRQLRVEAEAQASKARDQVEGFAGQSVAIRPELPQLERQLASGPDRLMSRAMQRNSRIQVAAHSADASEYASQAAYGRYLPRLNLTGEMYRDYRSGTLDADRDRWSVGLKLTVPLVDLSTASDISAAKERASADRYRALDTRRAVKTQFQNMWDDYKASRASADLAATKARAQGKVAAASLAKYRQGMTSLRDVLEDQRLLTAAELDELQLKVRMTYSICQILLTADAFDTAMLGN